MLPLLVIAGPVLTKIACDSSGVRMKPGLWPENTTPFGDGTGRAVFAKCGELNMPIGILAGFAEHADTLETLARGARFQRPHLSDGSADASVALDLLRFPADANHPRSLWEFYGSTNGRLGADESIQPFREHVPHSGQNRLVNVYIYNK